MSERTEVTDCSRPDAATFGGSPGAGLPSAPPSPITAFGAVKEDTLVVHEIYASIQGESTFAGMPCTFVRLTGCNLRCVWCDTPQAFYGGTRMQRADVLARTLSMGTPLVELTGGDPLLQPRSIPLL